MTRYFAHCPSFIENIHRIAEPGYVPTTADILHLPPKHKNVKEVGFSMDKLTIRIFDSDNGQNNSIKLFGDAEAIIFVVNIACYDKEYQGTNQLMETLNHFKGTVHSPWLKKPSIILLLNKAKEFEEKLLKIPLSKNFPDYSHGTNMDLAAKYTLKRFVQVNRPDLKLRPYLVDLDHISVQDLIFSAVKEMVFTEGISEMPKLRKWK